MPHIPDEPHEAPSARGEHTIDIRATRSSSKKTRRISYWRNQIGEKNVDLRAFAPRKPKKKLAVAIVPTRESPAPAQTLIFPPVSRPYAKASSISSSSPSIQALSRDDLLQQLEEIEQNHIRLQEAIGAPVSESKSLQSEYAPWTSINNDETFSALSLLVPSGTYRNFATRGNPSRKAASRYGLIPEMQRATAHPAIKKKGKAGSLIGGAVVLLLIALSVGIWQRGQGLEGRVAPDILQAYDSLEQAKADLTALRFAEATSEFSSAERKFSDAEIATESVGGPLLAKALAASPMPNKARSGIRLIAAGREFSRAGTDVSHAAFLLTAGKQAPTQDSFLSVFAEAMRELSDAQIQITQAQSDLAYVRIEDIPQNYQAQFSDAIARLSDANGMFQSIGPLSDSLMTLAGMQNEKSYLLLFQNPAEIRATGGFLGTYGILKVNQGQIKSIMADGTYNADGQLMTNVVPPYPVEYVSTAWSMHDANWFFDFPTSAEKVIWFYEKTGGATPDGVIAITPQLVENLLSLTGPIAMPTYHMILSADNFEDVVQQQVEVNYDKTQNRPKQILSDFIPVLFTRVQDMLPSHSADIVHILMRSLQQKDALLYTRDQNVERVFDAEGWSGHVVTPNSQGAQDVQDVLGVVQTNLGGYKTDRVIRITTQTATTLQADGSIHRTVIITRTHQGGKSIYDWYNKPNIDYMRVYVPAGSRLVQASGFSPQPPIPSFDYQQNNFSTDETVASTGLGSTKDPASNTDIFQENGMQVFGNWLILNPGETKTVQFEYVLPATFNAPSSYTLSLFSQAGVDPVLGVSLDSSGAGKISTCSQGSYDAQGMNLQKAAFNIDTKITCIIGK